MGISFLLLIFCLMRYKWLEKFISFYKWLFYLNCNNYLLVKSFWHTSNAIYLRPSVIKCYSASNLIFKLEFCKIENFLLSFKKILLAFSFCFTDYIIKFIASLLELLSILCNLSPYSFIFNSGFKNFIKFFIPYSYLIRRNSNNLKVGIENFSKCTFYPLNFLI